MDHIKTRKECEYNKEKLTHSFLNLQLSHTQNKNQLLGLHLYVVLDINKYHELRRKQEHSKSFATPFDYRSYEPEI